MTEHLPHASFAGRLIDACPDALILVSEEGSVRFWNRAAEIIFGYPFAEVLGRSLFDLIIPSEKASDTRRSLRIASESAPAPITYESVLRRKDGSLVAVDVTIKAATQDSPSGAEFIFAIKDITKMKSLREAKIIGAKFAGTLDCTPDAIVIVNREGYVLLVNLQTERLFGYPREALIGKMVEMLVPERFRAAHVRHRTAYFEAPRPRVVGAGLEIFGLRADGTEFPVEISLSPLETDEGLMAISSIRDLTDRKRAEADLRLAEEQLRQAEKMEAIGRLAGGIAHDFNNIAMIITGYSELLLASLRRGESLPDQIKQIEEIKSAGLRAANLTKQLLSFSRKQPAQLQEVNLNSVVSSVHTTVQRVIGEDIELVTVLAPKLGLVKADPGQLSEVITNLAMNARDAMPQGGQLFLETANEKIDKPLPTQYGAIPPGAYVVLSIRDTGHGMDPETMARIFEPFFTTKEQGKGSGLGLATVFGIIKQSEGYISVSSERGRGTAFKIYLPRVTKSGEQADVGLAQEGAPRGSETILLVEDEEGIRKLARRVLEQAGYIVLEAANGAMALEVSEQYRHQIHLLATDVIMPGLSGDELAQHLSALRPDMKVLYLTGYPEDLVSRQGDLVQKRLLQKPFSPDALLQKVREVLDTT